MQVLQKGRDYEVDEKRQTAFLTDDGLEVRHTEHAMPLRLSI